MATEDTQPDEQPQPPQITYGTARLGPFEVDAPTLTTNDGAVYVPIRWLCELLELAPSPWIGAVCAYYRHDRDPRDAIEPLHQLPYQRPDGAWRADWCLEWSRVVRWLSFRLRPSRLPQGFRRQQLEAFQEEVFERSSDIYEDRQRAYHDGKREILRLLQATAESLQTLDLLEPALGPHIEHSAPTPADGQAYRIAFAAVIEHGRALQHALADALRAALQPLLDTPITDAYEVDDEGLVNNTISTPILPPTPDFRAINQQMDLANTWFTHDLPLWLRTHGIAATFTQTHRSTDRQQNAPDRRDGEDNDR
jgi:hypothetical protein